MNFQKVPSGFNLIAERSGGAVQQDLGLSGEALELERHHMSLAEPQIAFDERWGMSPPIQTLGAAHAPSGPQIGFESLIAAASFRDPRA